MATESAILSRIEFHMSERFTRLSTVEDMDTVALWIKKYMDYGRQHQISLDSQQGLLMNVEVFRMLFNVCVCVCDCFDGVSAVYFTL